MAPIFDTGNSLFYNSEMIPSGQNLLEIAVSSFCKREVDMLRYVEHMDLFCLDLLDDFPQEAEEMFEKYTDMPVERAEAISHTIDRAEVRISESISAREKDMEKEEVLVR